MLLHVVDYDIICESLTLLPLECAKNVVTFFSEILLVQSFVIRRVITCDGVFKRSLSSIYLFSIVVERLKDIFSHPN